MIISGAGGRSRQQQPRIPVTTPDKASNQSYLEVLDAWSEGEIEGFAAASRSGFPRDSAEWNRAALKDIFLDGTPILRPETPIVVPPAVSDFNFQNVNLQFRWGTQDQPAIRNFTGVQTELPVGVVVRNGVPVTRRVTDPDVDAVRVTLSWAQLQWVQEDNDVQGLQQRWQIELSYNGGPFTVALFTLLPTTRSADPFALDQIVDLNGAFPVDVRVVRVSVNDEDWTEGGTVVSEFQWRGYTLIKRVRMRYPNTAHCGIRISAEDFGSIPTRSYRLRLLKVRIPSNGTVDLETGRITYDGIWDGTFTAAQWTSDPAWCLWDLLTASRYGFGDHLDANSLDKWAFYAASVYSNELVPSGVGNQQEPRFSCNVHIQNLTEAYKLINDLASVMRCMPYWSAGSITIAQDQPKDPVYLFTPTNIDGDFQYSGSSITQRHTVASVAWLDLDRQELAYEVVRDEAAIRRYGIITAEITGFACTTRSQAARLGRMLLATEQRETEIVTFRTALDAGVQVRPGMVVSISDPKKVGARQGGRIRAGTTTEITIDVPASSLPVAASPTVWVALSTGGVASRAVASSSGSVLTLATALPAAPLVGGAYIYAETISAWRVLGVKEEDRSQYQITAMTYDATKYDFVDRELPMGPTGFPTAVLPPSGADGGDWFGLTRLVEDDLLSLVD